MRRRGVAHHPVQRRALLLSVLAGCLLAGEAESPGTRDLFPYLIEIPADPVRFDSFALIISGDGGWADLDQQLGEILQSRGMSVLGWDSLNYFWKHRKAEEVAQDLDKAIRTYSELWNLPRVVLIGFSFGADVLPSAYNRLPPETREKVALISLLSTSKDVDYEVTASGFIGMGGSDEIPIGPELARMDQTKVQCVYGEEEADETGCLLLDPEKAQVIRTAGGHHFDEDYAKLADRILARLADAS